MMELLAMGKYGAFVWSSYGLATAVIIACTLQATRRERHIIGNLRRRQLTMDPAANDDTEANSRS